MTTMTIEVKNGGTAEWDGLPAEKREAATALFLMDAFGVAPVAAQVAAVGFVAAPGEWHSIAGNEVRLVTEDTGAAEAAETPCRVCHEPHPTEDTIDGCCPFCLAHANLEVDA